MADTTFSAGTVITSEWLNEVNNTVFSIGDVTRYGATGDGVTDDSAAIQLALDNHKHVVLPPGTYIVATPLVMRTGQTITGHGRPLVKSSVAGKHVLSGTSLSNITVEGVRFQGTGSTTVPTETVGAYSTTSIGLVTFVDCSDVRINACEADDFYNGFVTINCDRVVIFANYVHEWMLYGILASLSTDFMVDYNVIVGCDQAGAVNAYGIAATGDETSGASSIQRACSISNNIIRDIPSWDGIMTHDVSGLRIIGNDIRNVRVGIDLGHVTSVNFIRDLQIIGNIVESTTTNTWGVTAALHGGIVISGYDATHLVDGVQIIGNTVKGFFSVGSMVTAGNPSHIVAGFCKNTVIMGNTVKDGGTLASSAGVYVVGNSDSLSVMGNTLQGTFAAGGIRLASVVSSGAIITGNTIKQTTTSDSAIWISGSTLTSLTVSGNAHNSTVPLVVATSTVTLANTGSFTATLSGCTTSPTGSVAYSISGNQVTLTIPAISATSNSTSCTLTGLPSYLQPLTQTAVVPIIGQDNGTFTNNLVASIGASGTITLQRAGSSTGWTNSGIKGVYGCTITYSLH